jgi:hypothetical protein
MIRHDAQEFCKDIYPLLSRNQQDYDAGTFNHNPYELLVEGVMFGDVLGIPMPHGFDRDATINIALRRILTRFEADGTKGYLNVFSSSRPPANFHEDLGDDHTSQLNTWHEGFNRQFEEPLNELMRDKNIFAYFVLGLMRLDHGVTNANIPEQKRGEQYLQIAADGFCKLALDVLKWMYGPHQPTKNSRLNALTSKKLKFIRRLVIPENREFNGSINYIIENRIYEEKIYSLYSSCLGGLCSRRISDSTLIPPKYINDKLVPSFLMTEGFDQSFYRGVSKHLTKTTGAARRGAATTTASPFWRVQAICAPLTIITIGGYQMWYSLSYPSLSPTNSSNSILVTLDTAARNGASTSVVGSLALAYNAYLLYQSPLYVTLAEESLDKEIALSALLLTADHLAHAHEVDETIAETLINRWFNYRSSLCSWTKPPLSQLALAFRRGGLI